MLGDSSGDEGAPSRMPAAKRKLIIGKASGVDLVNSKALDSEGFQRILNLESSSRQGGGTTYNIDLAEEDMLKAGVGLHSEGEFLEEEWASDDVTGGDLDPSAVRAAREEEMTFIKSIPLYEEATVEQCRFKTGKGPISTKWVDIAKGNDVRSRWVARDVKPKGERDRADLFAAMPPLEAKRMLFRRFEDRQNLHGKHKMKLMLIDVKKGPPQRHLRAG